jgi:phosphomannomutase
LTGRVVQAVSLGYVSERIAGDFNLPFREVPVGFKYVAEEILKGGVILGGEESGGYAFSRTSSKDSRGADILPERDGLFSALLFLEMVLASGNKVSRLLKELEKRYGVSAYLRRDVFLPHPIEDKSAFDARIRNRLPDKWLGMKIRETRTLDGLKIVMEDGSWILVRPSGTEPLLRTYAEFPRMSLSRKSLDKISEMI